MRKTFQMQGAVDKEGQQVLIKISFIFGALALNLKNVDEDLACLLIEGE